MPISIGMDETKEETLQEGTIVFIAGEAWVLQENVRATLIPKFKCPHCGGTAGTWFDRSICVDRDGREIEGMSDRCCDCGKRV